MSGWNHAWSTCFCMHELHMMSQYVLRNTYRVCRINRHMYVQCCHKAYSQGAYVYHADSDPACTYVYTLKLYKLCTALRVVFVCAIIYTFHTPGKV